MNTWKQENNALVKEFKFSSFLEAIRFIDQVAVIAEELQHHPEITNMYDVVTLRLSTHEAGDIVTDKDYALAARIDDVG